MKRSNVRKLGSLAALLLFGVFAVCVLSVLLTGADTYRRLTARGDDSYDLRTGLQYVATKVCRAESGAAVSVGDFGGETCLVLAEHIDEDIYLTRIYCHEGWLCELFTPEDGEFCPEDGERVMELDSISFSLQGTLLSCTVPDADGSPVTQLLSLRGGEGATA